MTARATKSRVLPPRMDQGETEMTYDADTCEQTFHAALTAGDIKGVEADPMNTTTEIASASAALRTKLTGPDPRDGVTAVNIARRTRDVGMWPLRRDADADLRKLRERGLNVDKGVRIQRARTAFGRPFVITRLGEFGETLLMAADGSWVPGLLYPERPGDDGAIWQPYEGADVVPATFTHVVRTVRWSAARTERYKTKSNGSCGRWVWSDESVAVCTCKWKSYAVDRAEAQAAARAHRIEVAA